MDSEQLNSEALPTPRFCPVCGDPRTDLQDCCFACGEPLSLYQDDSAIEPMQWRIVGTFLIVLCGLGLGGLAAAFAQAGIGPGELLMLPPRIAVAAVPACVLGFSLCLGVYFLLFGRPPRLTSSPHGTERDFGEPARTSTDRDSAQFPPGSLPHPPGELRQ